MKSQLAEVQTGFEPLLFHIQADFQWQRPFSEGCGGWISEKSKKNLSQSYGRWIVGFHEPSPAPFLRSKRAVIRNACAFALEDDATLSYAEEKQLQSVQEQMELLWPQQTQEQRPTMELTMYYLAESRDFFSEVPVFCVQGGIS